MTPATKLVRVGLRGNIVLINEADFNPELHEPVSTSEPKSEPPVEAVEFSEGAVLISRMTAAEVKDVLNEASPDELVRFKAEELEGKKRKSVLKAIDQRWTELEA